MTGALAVRSAVDRLQGYKAALADCDIPIREELIIEGDFQQQTGYEIAKNLLQSVDPLPTAIFASNDLSAFGAMDAAREYGLRIPDDISIIGFDDIPQASLVYPKLTTVRQPLARNGAGRRQDANGANRGSGPSGATGGAGDATHHSRFCADPYQSRKDKRRQPIEKDRRQPIANKSTQFSP